MNETRFADTTRFVHETIDDETVLLDSVNGHLFLFTGLGPWLWNRLQRGAVPDDVVGEVAGRYGAAAEAPTRHFLDALGEAGMLQAEPPSAEPPAALSWPEAFEAPAVERYDDIADIVSMDPIHDVDPAKGWPRRSEPEVPKA